ncbi:hypothetical protein AB0J90_24085 [Micromonospora sp. NPDC049523]|uniref:hypothetical protein n=1 Tax=Micromonospora sp. NPDC049523 TaxID=3155921 RepID=UPI0034311A5C
MTEDITQQPLARAVLARLARTRSGDDPLGSLARTVLAGDADLRTAVTHSWHGGALGEAFTEALNRRNELTPTERAQVERQAQQLRDADEQPSADTAGNRGEGPDKEGGQC